MDDEFEELCVDIDFTTSRMISFCQQEDKNEIIVDVRVFNGRIIKFIFKEVVMIIYYGFDEIDKLIWNKSGHNIFHQVVKDSYLITDNPCKLLQFLDSMNEVSIEIACEDFACQFALD